MDQRKVLSSRKSSEDLTNADASSESSSTPATPPHGEQDIEKAGTSKHGNGDPNDVPDGGWAAWLVVLGTWCTSFCSFGWLNSIGVFQEYYQGTLLHGYSASTVAWIPSLQVFFMMGTGPFVGLIYDRYGHRWLLLIGSVMHVFGIMMASLGKTYYQILLAQGLCSAIGVSMIFTPCKCLPCFCCLSQLYSLTCASCQLHGGLVFEEPRSCVRSRLHRVKSRWRHISYHGHAPNS